MSTSPMQAEVLVSGAGPVGLFFAYQMAEYGHSVIIIDKKSGPTAESRAFFVTSRTLELLDHHGLAQQLLKEANIMRGTQLFVEGSLAGRATPDDTIETLFPQITIVPQSKTETAFVNALANTNTDILWNTELISYQQNEEGVVATVLSKDRQEKKIEAKYIIGADGCHSVVRKRGKGWTYEGVVIENKFALADVTLSGSGVDMLANHVNGFFHPDGLTLVVPIPNPEDKALFRVIGSMGQPSTTTHTDSSVTHGIASQAQSNTLIELETIQKIIDERMKPLQITAADPIWMTYFRVNERKANGFRRTRAFVMGDAAHCHSPAGGQGMNLGLQDANNLAWKLSLVLKGLSNDPEMLLDSYSLEREPVAERTIKETGNVTRLGLLNSAALSKLRNFAMYMAFALPMVRRNAIATVLQVRLSIESNSPLLRPSPSSSSYLISPGQFMPDTNPWRRRTLSDSSQFVQKTLRQILHKSPRHTALWISARHMWQNSDTLASVFWRKVSNYREAVRPIIVETSSHVGKYGNPDYVDDGSEENLWVDYHSSVLSKRIGLDQYLSNHENPPTALIILRPDLYVAHSCLVNTPEDIDEALSFLSTYLKQN